MYVVDFFGAGKPRIRRVSLLSDLDQPGSLVEIEVRTAVRYARFRRVRREDLFSNKRSALHWLTLFLLTHGGKRSVFHDSGGSSCNWVVAFSRQDAADVFQLEGNDDVEMGRSAQAWRRCHNDSVLNIWCDEQGVPTEPHSAGSSTQTRPMSWWSKRIGRGFLCSSEY